MLKEKYVYGIFIDGVEYYPSVYRTHNREVARSHKDYIKGIREGRKDNSKVEVKKVKKYIEQDFKVIKEIELI